MRTSNSINNTITSLICNSISYLFLFIGQTLLIKIMGIEYSGVNGLFSNVLTVLNLLECGIGNAIIFKLYNEISKNNQENIKSLMHFYKKMYYKIAFFIFLFGICLLPFLHFFIKDLSVPINIYIVYILFLLSTISTYLFSYKRSIIFASQRKTILNIIHIGYLITLNSAQIIILLITKNYYFYLIVKIICNLLENIIIGKKADKDYPYLLDQNVKPLKKNMRDDIVKRVRALFLHKMSATITFGTDNIIISSFLGIKTLGLYTSYYYIIHTIGNICKELVESPMASVGDLLVEKNREKNYIVFHRILFINLWLSIFTSISLYLLIPPFIELWLGKEFLLGSSVLFVLVINHFQYMMRFTFSIFKEASGIWVEDKFVPVFQLLINLVSSIILVRIIGLAGVFIGTILSTTVLWFYSYPKFVFKNLFGKSYFDYYFEMMKNLLLFICIFLICCFISQFFHSSNSFLVLMIYGVICFIVPNGILYLVYYKTREFKDTIIAIKKWGNRYEK